MTILKSLDIAIGLIVILLALSMAVTVITQAITSAINSRGAHLRRGLMDLLRQLVPGADEAIRKQIATAVLKHPLVSGSDMLGWGPRLGNVVHREELTKLLMALAIDGSAGAQGSTLEPKAKEALKSALASNDISNPAETLKKIRTRVMELELASPEVSHAVRQTKAVLETAQSDFVAKINGWFDQTMDRTTQRFTASTRAITFVGAFVVAFGLQVDTPFLVNRLASDDVLREALVQKAAPLAKADANVDTGFAKQYREFMAEAGIITLPSANWDDWKKGFTPDRWPGMLVTALLLSLGAPFWYNALRNLLQLRSTLAVKDDAQRTDRQEADAPPGTRQKP